MPSEPKQIPSEPKQIPSELKQIPSEHEHAEWAWKSRVSMKKSSEGKQVEWEYQNIESVPKLKRIMNLPLHNLLKMRYYYY